MNFELYSFGQIVGHARDDGSVDLLLGRGTRKARLVRIDKTGHKVLDRTLTDAMRTREHPWQDGYATDQAVFLFGAIGLKATRLPQGFVRRFDLKTGSLETRLAPLVGPGLEASIAARDEERQHLEDDPAQDPQILARIADSPLMISSVNRSGRRALQLTEVTDQLAAAP
jgi:hypothetical protein